MKTQIKPKTAGFYAKIRSRHPSHNVLRTKLGKLPFKSVIRLGSTTELPDTLQKGGIRIELNTVESIQNSSSKFRMKDCFLAGNVKTAEFFKVAEVKAKLKEGTWDTFPLVAKINFGSRGRGMYKIDNLEQLNTFLKKDTTGYYFERFYNYTREYRLHVNKSGCFYTCRKMLKSDTPEDKKYFRNDSNCVWVLEENPQFDRPSNWDNIVTECVKALTSVGLDMGACDVRVQSAKTEKGKVREVPDFIIVEINSAPSFGEVTAQKYLEVIPQILKEKAKLHIK